MNPSHNPSKPTAPLFPPFDPAPAAGSFVPENPTFASSGHRFFINESSSKASANSAASPPDLELYQGRERGGLHLNYGVAGSVDADNSLLRHSSWTAGMTSQPNGDNISRDIGRYSRPGLPDDGSIARRMKSQLSFSSGGSMYQISENGIPDMRASASHSNNLDDTSGNVGQSYNSSNFSIGSWDNANSIVFSAHSGKQVKDENGDIITISGLDPQMPLEMSAMEKYLQTHNDQVPFRVRAKRGCATHPRSIAERERRTKISDKLRKLQELVPNMDKQTNTSDMLDLAVQHIKVLQNQLQILNEEREKCTCTKNGR